MLRGRYRIGEVLWQPKDDENIRKARARYKAGIVCRTEKEAEEMAKMMSYMAKRVLYEVYTTAIRETLRDEEHV